MEKFGKIEVVPWEITEPDGLVVFNDARHGNRNGFNAGKDEIDTDLLEKVLVKDVLVRNGGETDRVKYLAFATDERDDGFGASNINTEKHNFSITSLAREGNNR